jgi:methionyl-tRNA formyltransferase
VRVNLLRAVPAELASAPAAPGTILAASKEGLIVAAGDPSAAPAPRGAVRVTELQPEGRRPLAARDFANGYRVRAGDRFDGGPA